MKKNESLEKGNTMKKRKIIVHEAIAKQSQVFVFACTYYQCFYGEIKPTKMAFSLTSFLKRYVLRLRELDEPLGDEKFFSDTTKQHPMIN